jgi:hypothetical protein
MSNDEFGMQLQRTEIALEPRRSVAAATLRKSARQQRIRDQKKCRTAIKPSGIL